MLQKFRKLFASDKGATAVEYGLIIALIVLAIIGALSTLAAKTNGMWSTVSNEVTSN